MANLAILALLAMCHGVATNPLVSGVAILATIGKSAMASVYQPEQLWMRQFGTTEYDGVRGIASDEGGGVFVAGFTGGSFPGPHMGRSDAFVARYDADGIRQWARQFGTSNLDESEAVALVASNRIVVTGYTYGTLPGATSSGGADVFVAGYDSRGLLLWRTQFGTSASEFPWSVASDGVTGVASGGCFVAGYTRGNFPGFPNRGRTDAFLAKFDRFGTRTWTRQFGTSDDDQIMALAPDGAGGVYVAGRTKGTLSGANPTPGVFDAFIAHYSSTGNRLWIRQYGTTGTDVARALSTDGAGGLLVAGWTGGRLGSGPSFGLFDAYVARYSAAGTRQWIRQFGTSSHDEASALALDENGSGPGFFVSGYTEGGLGGSSSGLGDAFTGRFDMAGNQSWFVQIGSSERDEGRGVASDGRGGVFMGGTARASLGPPHLGGSDGYLVRFGLPRSPMQPGDWTVIVHGFTWNGGFGYSQMIQPTGWMYRIGEAIEASSTTPVGIHSMDARDFGIVDLNNVSILDPSAHHVVLFDWSSNSGELGFDRHGWAYAAGASLHAFLKLWNKDDEVQALVGHSRGGVVISEVARRMILAGTPPRQVVFLDPEGEGPDLLGTSPLRFDDNRFRAWSSPTTKFQNIFSEFNESRCFPPLDLGNNPMVHASKRNLQSFYQHGSACSGIPGVYDFLIQTLRIENGALAWSEEPGLGTRAGDPGPPDPPSESGDILYNGDFETNSLAGWRYHGGNGLADPWRPFPNHGQGQVLRLQALRPSRTHGFFIMPNDATEFQMRFKAVGLVRTGELVGTLTASGVPSQVLVRRSLTQATPAFEPVRELVAPRFQGKVCRFTIAVDNTLLTVYVDDISFESTCYPDCDQSTGAGVLDIFDFLCFQNAFVSGDPYACDCNTATGPGVCDMLDFLCFQNAFVAGCP
ncbi:hypothetical protein JYU07_00465 [Roseiflexus sp. AH-315-K22]|nr:hypothetical protein [Roseiflexus sp. AH-315-K22]